MKIGPASGGAQGQQRPSQGGRMFSLPQRKQHIPHQKGAPGTPTLSVVGTLLPRVLARAGAAAQERLGATSGPCPLPSSTTDTSHSQSFPDPDTCNLVVFKKF